MGTTFDVTYVHAFFFFVHVFVLVKSECFTTFSAYLLSSNFLTHKCIHIRSGDFKGINSRSLYVALIKKSYLAEANVSFAHNKFLYIYKKLFWSKTNHYRLSASALPKEERVSGSFT